MALLVAMALAASASGGHAAPGGHAPTAVKARAGSGEAPAPTSEVSAILLLGIAGAPDDRALPAADGARSGAPSRTQKADRRGEEDGGSEAALDELRQAYAAAAAPLAHTTASEMASGRLSRAVDLWSVGAMAVTGELATVARLARHPSVRFALADPTVRLEPTVPSAAELPAPRPWPLAPAPLWNVQRVRADSVWDRLGIDGTGVTVAVIDSGVDYHHPLLQTRYRGYVEDSLPRNGGNLWCKREGDLLCGDGLLFPTDGNGHGTHVAGSVLAGGGVGVAPGARWISLRACPSVCPLSWLTESLQWLLELPPDDRPDILNASLTTNSDEALAVLEVLIGRLIDAGITVVAATGNGAGPPGMPALHPDVISVGATTPEDRVWSNSQFGRTRWGEVKPELVAPGTAITSTVPGGGFAMLNGTSMAAPHAAGAAALLLQAQPELSPAQVREALMRTARALGSEVPDPATGWGLVDAFAAVRSVSDIGTLRGRIGRHPDGIVIPWARARVARLDGEPVAQASVDDDGGFSFELAPGEYLLAAEAFAYRTQTTRGPDGAGLRVRKGETTEVEEIRLERETPTGIFAGTITDAVSGAPLTATLQLSGVPFDVKSNRLGDFEEQLPPNTYSVRVERFGYRVRTDTIKVDAGGTLRRDYALEPAPKILLVDGDAWLFGTAIDAYRDSLSRNGFTWREHHVTDERVGVGHTGGPPDLEELTRNDVVIWSSSLAGPAFVRGATPLSNYLAGGGALLLSGQDALCVDAGIDNPLAPCLRNARPHTYVGEQLKLRVTDDDSGSDVVVGAPGGPLEGITLTLNGPDSMDNQHAPDAFESLDELHTRIVGRYAVAPSGSSGGAEATWNTGADGPDDGDGSGESGDLGGGAIALSGRCMPHRAVALGFGFEGVAGSANRDALMLRLLELLTEPEPEAGLYTATGDSGVVTGPGSSAQHNVRVTSLGGPRVQVTPTLEVGAWPAVLVSSEDGEPWSGTLALDACAPRTLGVVVDVPADTERGAADVSRLRFIPDVGVDEAVLEIRTRSTAAVLLVDGEYVGNRGSRIADGLGAASVQYDYWEVGRASVRPSLPTSETLGMYPAVVWFTGYDPRPTGTIPPEGLRSLSDYLDAGGRLLLSAEDLLRTQGAKPFQDDRLFQVDYLGVASYSDDRGRAHLGPMRGAESSAFASVSGCRLEHREEVDDFSDRLEPRPVARAALLDVFGSPVATQFASEAFRSIFLAFDASLLEPGCAQEIMRLGVDWLSPVTDSRLERLDPEGRATTRRVYATGETVDLRLTLRAGGASERVRTGVEWSMPEGAIVSTGTLPADWSWDSEARELTWTGWVEPDRPTAAVVEVELGPGLPAGAELRSVARITGDGLPAVRGTSWRVDAPDLSGSAKFADGSRSPPPAPGAEITYSINLRNDGVADAAFTVTDSLPAGLLLVEDSTFLSDPTGRVEVEPDVGRLVWTGRLEPRSVTAMQYRARIVSFSGGPLRNRALVDDGAGQRTALEHTLFVRPRLALPWLGRELEPDP